MSGRSDLAQACPVKDIPVWAFHGDGDRVAPTVYSIDMVNAIRACEPAGIYNPRLNILNARDHEGWNEIYNGSSGYKVYEWLLMFRKNETSNKKPYVSAGHDLRLRLRNKPLHIMGDFFDWDGKISGIRWTQTAGPALTLNNTASAALELSGLKTGRYEFELTVTDDKGASNSDKVNIEITDNSVLPEVTELVLIDGKTGAEVGRLSEGQVIDRSALGLTEVNIQAVASAATESVRFSINTDQNTRTPNQSPYLIKNQTSGPEWQIQNGVYLICATPYTGNNAAGDPGVSQCYQITVTDGSTDQPCAGTGHIQQEIWTGIPGTEISSIPLSSNPTSAKDVTLFEAPANIADNYGSRMRGYVCPPTSGNYTFWISGNDRTELWLSTDDNPANKRRIAFTEKYTNPRQWDKYSTQQSSPIALRAHTRYYIEALQKEGVGSDHVAVGWKLPDGQFERPIPGTRLMPFDGSGSTAIPVVTIVSPEDEETFTAPAKIELMASATITEGSIAKVEFYNGTTKLGEDATSPYSFTWNDVKEGSYTILIKAIGDAGGTGKSSVDIVVAAGEACSGAGAIHQEMWTGISGTEISSIPLNSEPATVNVLTLFEAPSNIGDNYGSRIRGYICPPASDNYTFWISGNDRTELWLSTNETPDSKRRIAYAEKYTNPEQWNKYSSQQSAPIALQAHQRYYIEALHKEGVGSDHLAVGWQLPDGSMERPIAGSHLIPFESGATMRASAVMTLMGHDSATMSKDEDINIYPNPIYHDASQLILTGFGSTDGQFEGSIQIQRMTGEIVYFKPMNRGQSAPEYSIAVDDILSAGVYIVTINVDGRIQTRRLLVR